ncbi:Transcription initiation factor TFIID subunit 12 [Nakaseomyces bracarensis]|uniref:Transcription initiation factor TFIID subunit 12 n=1 Tax=Nakaseomyces bracarensis TaxID=273131 RepID=A0ABR4NT92_9SACH
MSSNDSSQDVPKPEQSAPAKSIQHKQIQELTARFKQLVSEAKKVGETTPRGKELLLQAAKLKAVYENYTRRQALARAQQAQAQAQAQQGQGAAQTQTQSSAHALAPGGSASGSSGSQPNASGGSSGSSGSQLANIIKQVLTPEQNQQYESLLQNFQARASAIKDKHTFIKQNIDRLVVEINKQTDEEAKKQLNEKKTELLRNIKAIRLEHQALQQELQNSKKNFYIECARQNPALQRLLQRSSQQQRMMQQQKQQQQPSQAATPAPVANAQGSAAATAPQTAQAAAPAPAVPSTENMNQPIKQEMKPPIKSEASGSTPATQTPGNTGSQQGMTPNAQGQQSPITNVNAAASSASSNTVSKSSIFKPSDPTVPIADNLSVKPPSPVAYRSNRPTISDGSAMNATALNTPAVTTLPPYEIDTDRVMSKRKLRELVKSIGVDEGDGETVIDGDVEEILLDLADDFVTNVTSFACRLAKHRKSDNLEPRDIQLHLERNWNIRIPGYSADEIRSVRKWNASAAYNQKISSITSEKTANNAAAASTISNKGKPSNFQK